MRLIMRSLNAKLTYRCNNNCKFCFSSYLKDVQISLDALLKAVDYGYERGCRSLVLSGGEPTLLPDAMIKIIEHANKLGYESYTIQTNGSGLSEKNLLFHFLKNIADENRLSISFSIHGPNSHTHDAISSRSGAFDSLLQSIENFSSSTKASIYTNSVISALNIKILHDIATLLSRYRIQLMQFAVMHSEQTDDLSVGLFSSANAVHTLTEIVPRHVLRTEGIPYCMMYGYEECVGESYWPANLDLFNKDNEYMCDFDQSSSGMRKKASFCSQCVMNEICVGSWTEHYEELLKYASPIH